MDGNRFDNLARSLATRASRRALLGAALGALTAGFFGGKAAGAGRPLGSICRKHGECESRVCGPKDASGRQRCVCGKPSDCPVPTQACRAATCTNGVCGTGNAANGTFCTDGNGCTVGDICQNGVCQPGTPKSCPACQACSGGQCRAVNTDARCATACCNGTCCPDGQTCINGKCAAACKPVQSLCNMGANDCCQDEFTDCTPEANSVQTQGEARCCRINGVSCSVDGDCCASASCIDGVCGLGPGQQCLDRTECGEFGAECCNGVCRTLANDPANCGACGKVCPAPPPGGRAVCDTFTCKVECTGGRTLCNGACVKTQTDNANCGGCGSACPPGETCCGGRCTNVRSDEANCGYCGSQCGAGETCCDRFCVFLESDVFNCGQCEFACLGAKSGEVACCYGECTELRKDRYNCGACGFVCPPDFECTLGGVCLRRPCGPSGINC